MHAATGEWTGAHLVLRRQQDDSYHPAYREQRPGPRHQLSALQNGPVRGETEGTGTVPSAGGAGDRNAWCELTT